MQTVHGTLVDEMDGVPEPPFIAVKGSPSEVLAMCTWYMREGTRIPLSEGDRRRIIQENE